jgi:hypothetical protein
MNNYKDVYQNLMNITNSIHDIQKLQKLHNEIINGGNIIINSLTSNNLSTDTLSTNTITTNYPNGLTIKGNGYGTTSGTSPLLTVSGQQTGVSAYANDMFKVNNDGSVVVGSYDRIISGSTVPALTVYGSIDIEDGFINAPNIISSISNNDGSIAIQGTYANKRISIANPLPTLNNTVGTISSLYSGSSTVGSLNVSNGTFSTLYSRSGTVGSLNVNSGTIGSLTVRPPTIANTPLISTTSGLLQYNDQALLKSSNVEFNSGTVDRLITEYIYSNNNHTIYIDTPSTDTNDNIKLYIGTKALNGIPNAIPQVVISSINNQSTNSYGAPALITYGGGMFWSRLAIGGFINESYGTHNDGTPTQGGNINGLYVYGVSKFIASGADTTNTGRSVVFINTNNKTKPDNTPLYAIYLETSNGGIYMNGGNIIGSSDYRVKENISNVDNISILDKVLKLSLKNYKYIDDIFNKNHYGFIAQEVYNIFPDSVKIDSGYIPSIYKFAEKIILINKCVIIKVFLPNNLKLKNNDKIKLLIDSDEIFVPVFICNNNELYVEKWDSFNLDKKVFVYGHYVDDLHGLDYQSISTISIGAIQELYNIIIELKNEIQILKEKIK